MVSSQFIAHYIVIWLKIKFLPPVNCLAGTRLMGKWRARTSRGKNKNKTRTEADRNALRSQEALAARETQRKARSEAKARTAIQSDLDQVTAELAATQLGGITTRTAAQAKLDEVTARVAIRQDRIRQLQRISGLPAASSSSSAPDPPAAKWAAKPKRALPQPIAGWHWPETKEEPIEVEPIVATTDPYEFDNWYQ